MYLSFNIICSVFFLSCPSFRFLFVFISTLVIFFFLSFFLSSLNLKQRSIAIYCSEIIYIIEYKNADRGTSEHNTMINIIFTYII